MGFDISCFFFLFFLLLWSRKENAALAGTTNDCRHCGSFHALDTEAKHLVVCVWAQRWWRREAESREMAVSLSEDMMMALALKEWPTGKSPAIRRWKRDVARTRAPWTLSSLSFAAVFFPPPTVLLIRAYSLSSYPVSYLTHPSSFFFVPFSRLVRCNIPLRKHFFFYFLSSLLPFARREI